MGGRTQVLLGWLGVCIVAVAGIWSLAYAAVIVYELLGYAGVVALILLALTTCVDGPRSRLVGVGLLLGIVLLAPWYALTMHGDWQPLLVAYGGQLAGLAMLALPIWLDRARPSARDHQSRSWRPADLADLQDRTAGARGV
jgi:hypothetical protein